MRYVTVLFMAFLLWLPVLQAAVLALPFCRITHFDEFNGLSQRFVKQIVQDKTGMMWIATWNGLNRYDGYAFETVKPHVGDGSGIYSDRINDIKLSATGNLWCRVDDRCLLFDVGTYRFTDFLSAVERRMHRHFSVTGIRTTTDGHMVMACADGTFLTVDDADPVGTAHLSTAEPQLDYVKVGNRRYESFAGIADADLIFMLDHNTVAREGDLENWVVASPAGRVIIDHHPDPDPQQYVISDTQVSSTCELLYIVMSQIWGKEIVTPDIAGALYTGINTDTGGLSHNSSHPQTYRIIADLLEAGLDKAYIHERIYQMNNLSRLRLIGNVLLNKLEVNEQYPVAIMPITREELDRYNYKDGDLEGLVNIPLSVHNVCVSVQITERRERVKLSFRSKGNVPVNEWAKAFFNGGGHLNAAGGQMDLPLAEVVRKVKETIPWFFEQLKNSGI